jgi:hypothetical protein
VVALQILASLERMPERLDLDLVNGGARFQVAYPIVYVVEFIGFIGYTKRRSRKRERRSNKPKQRDDWGY